MPKRTEKRDVPEELRKGADIPFDDLLPMSHRDCRDTARQNYEAAEKRQRQARAAAQGSSKPLLISS